MTLFDQQAAVPARNRQGGDSLCFWMPSSQDGDGIGFTSHRADPCHQPARIAGQPAGCLALAASWWLAKATTAPSSPPVDSSRAVEPQLTTAIHPWWSATAATPWSNSGADEGPAGFAAAGDRGVPDTVQATVGDALNRPRRLGYRLCSGPWNRCPWMPPAAGGALPGSGHGVAAMPTAALAGPAWSLTTPTGARIGCFTLADQLAEPGVSRLLRKGNAG